MRPLQRSDAALLGISPSLAYICLLGGRSLIVVLRCALCAVLCRYLLEGAKHVVNALGGSFPTTAKELLSIPGKCTPAPAVAGPRS